MWRTGLDLKGLQADIKSAQRIVESGAMARSSAAQRAFSGGGSGGHGGGGGHGSGMLGGAGNNRAIGDALDAATGQRGWVMRMTMLQHSLPIAAAAMLAVGLAKSKEKFDELVAASEKAREALSKPMTTAIGAGGGSAASYIEGIQKAREGLREASTGSNGVMATIGAMFSQVSGKVMNMANVGGSNAFDETNHIVEAKRRAAQLDKAALDAALQFKQLTKEQIAERQAAYEIGEKELALVIAQQRLKKEKDDIAANGKGIGTNSALIDEKQAAYDLEVKEIERKHAAQERELDLQRAILSIKMIGKDVAVQEAQERLKAADLEFKLAKPEEKGAASVKQQAAALELRDAQRMTDEHRAQLSLASAIADYRAPEEEKMLETLRDETDDLEGQLQTLGAQDDKRKDIQKRIDENNSKIRAAERAQDARAHTRADTLIDAKTGSGQAEQAKNIALKLAEAQRYQGQIAGNPEVSPDEKAAIAEKVNSLKKQQDEIKRSRDKSVRDAQAEVAVMTQQLEQHAAIAEALRTRQGFEDKIAEAHRDGNTELEKQLRLQQQIAVATQIQKLQVQQDDRSKGSLSGLAAHAFNQTGAAARSAQRLEKRAQVEADRGHFDRAKVLHAQADKIKNGIGPLKDAEKEGGRVQEQIDLLSKIEANTAKAGLVGP